MSGCGRSLYWLHAITIVRQSCLPIPDRLSADRCLLPTRRELGSGCYGGSLSNNTKIQVLGKAVAQGLCGVIEIVRGDRSDLDDYKGPCYEGGPI